MDDSTPTRAEGEYKATVLCWFFGLGTLLGFNALLTIADYYYEVFPHYHPSRILPLVYQPFSFGTMIILTCYKTKMSTRKRILFGFILLCSSISLLALIALVTSGKGGILYYVGVCLLVACLGVGGACVEGGIVGDLSYMDPDFMQSFFAGLAASGTTTSVLRLITKSVFDQTKHGLHKGAILFLLVAMLYEFLCILFYAFVFGKLPVVKRYRRKAALEGNDYATDNEAEHSLLTNWQLLVQTKDYVFNLWLTYAITLSIFPGFLYENSGHHQLGSWYAVVLVAIYNVWDLFGRYVPLVDCTRLESRNGLIAACLSRLLLVPCFYFTARHGEQGWMMMLVSVLGVTNGYLTVCVLRVAPRGYKASEQKALGNLLVVFLLSGIFSGAALGLLWLIGK